MAQVVLTMSFNIKDSHGVSATAPYPVAVDDTLALSAVRTQWLALGTLLDAATDGKVTGGRVTFLQPGDNGWKANPTATSDVSMAGVMQFSMQNTTHQASAVVPALIESAQSAGKVNLNQTGLKEFIYGLYHGFGTGSAYKLTNATGNTVTGINRGFLGTRKHRRQQQSKTMMDGSGFVPPA